MTVLAKRVLAGLLVTGLLFAVGRFLFVRWQVAQEQLITLTASVEWVEAQRRLSAEEAAKATERLRVVLEQQRDRNEYYATYTENMQRAILKLDTSCTLDAELPRLLNQSYDAHIRRARANE